MRLQRFGLLLLLVILCQYDYGFAMAQNGMSSSQYYRPSNYPSQDPDKPSWDFQKNYDQYNNYDDNPSNNYDRNGNNRNYGGSSGSYNDGSYGQGSSGGYPTKNDQSGYGYGGSGDYAQLTLFGTFQVINGTLRLTVKDPYGLLQQLLNKVNRSLSVNVNVNGQLINVTVQETPDDRTLKLSVNDISLTSILSTLSDGHVTNIDYINFNLSPILLSLFLNRTLPLSQILSGITNLTPSQSLSLATILSVLPNTSLVQIQALNLTPNITQLQAIIQLLGLGNLPILNQILNSILGSFCIGFNLETNLQFIPILITASVSVQSDSISTYPQCNYNNYQMNYGSGYPYGGGPNGPSNRYPKPYLDDPDYNYSQDYQDSSSKYSQKQPYNGGRSGGYPKNNNRYSSDRGGNYGDRQYNNYNNDDDYPNNNNNRYSGNRGGNYGDGPDDNYNNDDDYPNNNNGYSNNKGGDYDNNYQASEYRSPRQRKSPDSLGHMSIYFRTPSNDGRRRKPKRIRFPTARYERRRFPNFGPLISFFPWLPIFADRLSKQTIIFSPTGGVYIIPPVINFYGKLYSVAELIASGYCSLVSAGTMPLPAVDVAPLVNPTPVVGPATPVINPATGGFRGGVKTNFRSLEGPKYPRTFEEDGYDNQARNSGPSPRPGY